MQRFVIIAPDTDAALSEEVNGILQEEGAGYWHLVADVWFVVDPHPRRTTVEWRDLVRDRLITAGGHGLVVVVKADDNANWSAYGPTDWFDWFPDQWEQ